MAKSFLLHSLCSLQKSQLAGMLFPKTESRRDKTNEPRTSSLAGRGGSGWGGRAERSAQGCVGPPECRDSSGTAPGLRRDSSGTAPGLLRDSVRLSGSALPPLRARSPFPVRPRPLQAARGAAPAGPHRGLGKARGETRGFPKGIPGSVPAQPGPLRGRSCQGSPAGCTWLLAPPQRGIRERAAAEGSPIPVAV